MSRKKKKGKFILNKAPAETKPTLGYVQIYTDGGCKGTEGGWAFSMRSGEHSCYCAGAAKNTTNNRMELTALLKAFEKLNRPCLVDLYCDSQYVLNGLMYTFTWERKGWKTAEGKPVANADLWKRMIVFRDYHTIRKHWVKGHSGNIENEVCDSLATYARVIKEYEPEVEL